MSDVVVVSKRRTAGDWSRDERHVQFGAGVGGWVTVPQFYLLALNMLAPDTGDILLEKLIGEDARLLLDSGIFALTNEHARLFGSTMNEALALAPSEILGFDKLFESYVDLATRWGERLWGYIELDQGGAENKRKTRAHLHDLGLDPIPVYHPLHDGWDYFDELAEGYERICVGNLVQASADTRVRLLHTLWERHRAYPDLWIHVLGVSPSDMCLAFPPDSCDNSSWCSGVRWPTVGMGSSMLDVLSANTDPAFRYGSPTTLPWVEHYRAWRPLTNEYFAAVGAYSDEVDFINLNWRRIVADRESELGELYLPDYLPGEIALQPGKLQ